MKYGFVSFGIAYMLPKSSVSTLLGYSNILLSVDFIGDAVEMQHFDKPR